MFKCEHCSKIFPSIRSLNGHSRIHGISAGKLPQLRCCCIITKKEISVDRLPRFQSNIKYCIHCNMPLDSNRKFCNASCAATFNNTDRIKHGYVITDAHKDKVSKSVSAYHKSAHKIKSKPERKAKLPKPVRKRVAQRRSPVRNRETNKTASGVFSKLYMCKCQHCGIIISQRRATKYCTKCVTIYSPAEKQRYKFTFNVYHYPDLFDLTLIDKFGWFSPNNFKGQKWNPDGISRDHRVSVHDALKYNYDAFYITHPLNCELMQHTENNKKKTISSIEYSELVKLVENYINP